MSGTGTAPRTGRRLVPLMPRRAYRVMLITHIALAVGWFGIDLALLTLGLTAATTGDPETLKASYLAMKVLGTAAVIPISLLAILTGLLLALGSRYGLFKHWWVVTKLVVATLAAVLSIFVLRGRIAEAVDAVTGVPVGSLTYDAVGDVGSTLIIAPIVAGAMYVTNIIVSVVKPWGRTGTRSD
jgi:hypothetical protein